MRSSFLLGLGLVLLTPPLFATNQPPETPQARGDRITALLLKESLGPLRLNLPEREVLRLMGEPGKRSAIVHIEANGLDVQEWLYPKAGLALKMASNTGKTGSKFLTGISARGKCTLATQRGIHIGSAQAAVQKAYGGTEDLESQKAHGLGGTYFVVGSVFSGLTFEFTRGQVSWIYLGAVMECETLPQMNVRG